MRFYQWFIKLLLERRSIRKNKKDLIPQDIIDDIINAIFIQQMVEKRRIQ